MLRVSYQKPVTHIPFERISWVDIVTITLLLRMGYIGFRLGLGAELVKLAGTVAGLFLSFRIYQAAGDFLVSKVSLGTEWAAVLAMMVLVVFGYFIVTRLLSLLGYLAKLTFDKKLDHAGGFLAGLVRGLLVTSVVWVACLQLPSDYLQEFIRKHSLSGEVVSRMAPAVFDALTRFSHRLLG